MESIYTVQEDIRYVSVSLELAPSSGTLLSDTTLYITSTAGSASGIIVMYAKSGSVG